MKMHYDLRLNDPLIENIPRFAAFRFEIKILF